MHERRKRWIKPPKNGETGEEMDTKESLSNFLELNEVSLMPLCSAATVYLGCSTTCGMWAIPTMHTPALACHTPP